MTATMASFLKLTLVGDGGVGKSCLILQYMYGDVSLYLFIELNVLINFKINSLLRNMNQLKRTPIDEQLLYKAMKYKLIY